MERVPLDGSESVEAVPGVHLTQLAEGQGMSVQHFRIEPGATVPEHSHLHEQAGWVQDGAGVFLVEGEELLVRAGDSYSIPSGQPHAVEVRSDDPLVGVDIFHPPRPAPDWDD